MREQTRTRIVRVRSYGRVMTDFTDANLRGSRFERADLSGSQFWASDLAGARFREVDLSGVVMRGVELAMSRSTARSRT